MIVIAMTLVGATVAGTTGYGLGLMLLPILSLSLGTRTAVPALAIVQLTSNFSRAIINRKQIEFHYGIWFGIGALPGALIGAWLFSHLPVHGLASIVGIYLILIPFLRRRFSRSFQIPPPGFVAVGFVTSLVSSLIGVVGPLCAPFFLSIGLTRGAFVGTEAVGSVFTHVFKLTGYGLNHVLTSKEVFLGLALSPITWVGSWIGKHAANRLKDHHFANLIDGVCVFFGILLIWKGH